MSISENPLCSLKAKSPLAKQIIQQTIIRVFSADILANVADISLRTLHDISHAYIIHTSQQTSHVDVKVRSDTSQSPELTPILPRNRGRHTVCTIQTHTSKHRLTLLKRLLADTPLRLSRHPSGLKEDTLTGPKQTRWCTLCRLAVTSRKTALLSVSVCVTQHEIGRNGVWHMLKNYDFLPVQWGGGCRGGGWGVALPPRVHRVHIGVEQKSALSWSVHPNFACDVRCSERGGRTTPPPSPDWANFSVNDGMFSRTWSLPLCVSSVRLSPRRCQRVSIMPSFYCE